MEERQRLLNGDSLQVRYDGQNGYDNAQDSTITGNGTADPSGVKIERRRFEISKNQIEIPQSDTHVSTCIFT